MSSSQAEAREVAGGGEAEVIYLPTESSAGTVHGEEEEMSTVYSERLTGRGL